MAFGDVAWVGKGPGGELLPVGIEFKKLGELLTSILDNRFVGHQLPGMQANYRVMYLLVEGSWRPGTGGTLEVHEKGRWRAPHTRAMNHLGLEHWLATISEQGGITVLRSGNREESLAILHARYTWWSKAWEKHAALKGIYNGAAARRVSLLAPTWRHRIARVLPGLGDEKSATVDQHFKNVREMVNANELDWMKVPGVGKEIARKIQWVMTSEK